METSQAELNKVADFGSLSLKILDLTDLVWISKNLGIWRKA
jgi:hypothetical protein